MTNQDKPIDEELRLNDEVEKTTANFVRAVQEMVKRGSFPISVSTPPFFYTLELMEYVLSLDFANRGKGDLADLNLVCGEDVIMAKAVALEHALEAANVASFQEWEEWRNAEENLEGYLEHKKINKQ